MRVLCMGGVAAVLFFAVGCGPAAKTVDGTWAATGVKDMPPGGTVMMTFSAPDQAKMVVTAQETGFSLTATATGTYKLAGDQLTINFTKADTMLNGLKPEEQKLFEANKAAADAAFLEKIGGPRLSKVKWVDDKTIEMAENGTTTTLKKQA